MEQVLYCQQVGWLEALTNPYSILSFQTDIGFIYNSPGRQQLLEIYVSSEKNQVRC